MMQIGISGTFDVQNYGDLLFPIVAEAELTRRLGPIDLHRLSYTAKQTPDWPFRVTSLVELPKKARELDGMLIGGGDLIRFDKSVAPDYHAPAAHIHHPTGYWLMPSLFALQEGCPVVWNAPGAWGDIPSWAEPLIRTAIKNSSYVAVRDERTRKTLLPFANGNNISVVPDTGFGIARIVDPSRPSDRYGSLRREFGLSGPYVIIQADSRLAHFARFVAANRDRLGGYQFLLLPIGPALGDRNSELAGAFEDFVSLPYWPDPVLLAELIAGASGVVGTSLHLAISALSFGLPVFRPGSEFEGKYAVLEQYESVHSFLYEGEIDVSWFERRLLKRGLAPELPQVFRALDQHWDKVADCFATSRTASTAPDLFGELAQHLPEILESRERLVTELQIVQQFLRAQHLTVSQRDRHIESANQASGRTVQSSEDKSMPSNDPEAQECAGTRFSAGQPEAPSDARLNAIIAERDRQISARDATVADRNTTIAELTNMLNIRDQRTAELEAALQHRTDELVSLGRQIGQLGSVVQVCTDRIRMLQKSTSWKATAPLRWLGRLARGSRSYANIIRFESLDRQALKREPYDWAFANDMFARSDANALVAGYPTDHFKTVKGYDGEKGYEYEARALIHLGATSPAFAEELSPAWRRLASDLLLPEYRAAMTRLVGRELMTAPMEAYVCHFGPGAWLGPHLDLKDKIVTHVFYFNESWNPKDGGCLNILQSSDMNDSVAEISPVVGNTSVLVRSNNSWHSVSRVVDGCRISRRSMNVIFYHSGAVSTMWPPGDDTPLHSYRPEHG